MRQICVPDIDSDHKIIVTNLVNEILAVKAADPNVDTSNLEGNIDKLVYDLYDLTDDEIKIVEGRE